MSPFGDGANVVWWTQKKTETRLCVGDMLYYGGANVGDTKAIQGCGSKVTLQKTQLHSLLIPLLSFEF